jgi:hypothetical protein
MTLISTYFRTRTLRRCLDNPPPHKPGFVFVFCDFGAGHDDNVIVRGTGTRLRLWRHGKRGTRKLLRVGLSGVCEVEGETQPGSRRRSDKEMLDLIDRGGWPIGRQNFGQRIPHDLTYMSWSSRSLDGGGVGYRPMRVDFTAGRRSLCGINHPDEEAAPLRQMAGRREV